MQPERMVFSPVNLSLSSGSPLSQLEEGRVSSETRAAGLSTRNDFISEAPPSPKVVESKKSAQGSQADREQRADITQRDIPEAVQQALARRNIQLAFEIDKETQRMYLALRDGQTGEIIRQIPPEEQLRWAQRIEAYLEQIQQSRTSDSEGNAGLLLSTQA